MKAQVRRTAVHTASGTANENRNFRHVEEISRPDPVVEKTFGDHPPTSSPELRWLDRKLLLALRKLTGPAPIRLALGDIVESSPAPVNSPTLTIRDRRALITLLRNPDLNFGDLYSEGQIEVDGDLTSMLETLYRFSKKKSAWYGRQLSRWFGWVQGNSLRGSRRNIHHHYDLSTSFYQRWLDSRMQYTCAYFPSEVATLEEAQTAKLDLVCRKLWLRAGEKVVEAGCGWGEFALHMARHYGVKVKAFNISHEQIAYARERVREEGLSGQVEFIEDDYRNIREQCDVFVSVGMLEHVGRSHYGDLGRVIHRTIRDQGRGLLHFIGRNRPQPLNAWISKRIFPGAYPPSIREMMTVLEPWDFSVLDVENLRLHYAKTLEHWLARSERFFDAVVHQYGLEFARRWRLYLAGSIASFRTGSLQLFQVVFAGQKCAIPWNRAYLYDNPGNAEAAR